MESRKRETAYKVTIGEILNGIYIKSVGEWDSNFIQVNNLKVSRVNIVANIVDKYVSNDNNYATATIDDGTGQISLRYWKDEVANLMGLSVGSLILIIGRVREFNGQRYITTEILRKLDNPIWAKYRKRELNKRKFTSTEIKKSEILKVSPEKVVESNIRKKLLESIQRLDKENGADFFEIVKDLRETEERVNELIETLLKEGEIFELKPGKLRVML